MARIVRARNAGWHEIIASAARVAGVATITTSQDHGFSEGDKLTVTCDDSAYDVEGVAITSVPSSTSLTYANDGGDESSKAASGYVGVEDFWEGQGIAPNAYYTLDLDASPPEDVRWKKNSKVQADISSGALVINDNTNDISDHNVAISYLSFTNAPLPYIESYNGAAFATSAIEYITIPGTEFTPSGGSYLCLFYGMVTNSSKWLDTHITMAIDDVHEEHTIRDIDGKRKHIGLDSILVVDGTNVISVVVKTVGSGSTEISRWCMKLIKIG